jgi:hypothetical protein
MGDAGRDRLSEHDAEGRFGALDKDIGSGFSVFAFYRLVIKWFHEKLKTTAHTSRSGAGHRPIQRGDFSLADG